MKMKKILILCMIFAGAFTGYSDSPQKSEQVAITGYGGYSLGEMLNPEQLDKKMRENGYVDCKAKKPFRNFVSVRLYFTPKTFLIYKIESGVKGGGIGELAPLKAALEKKYNEKMKEVFRGYSLSRGDRTIFATHRDEGYARLSVFISVIDNKLLEQGRKEHDEIEQEVDISGL